MSVDALRQITKAERWRAVAAAVALRQGPLPGSIGLAWTQDVGVAQMFGRGLNATKTGGVLLQGTFIPALIISGPNEHSSYLQEEQFTVEPPLAQDVKVVEEYPPL
jgi:hypothetical protein